MFVRGWGEKGDNKRGTLRSQNFKTSVHRKAGPGEEKIGLAERGDSEQGPKKRGYRGGARRKERRGAPEEGFKRNLGGRVHPPLLPEGKCQYLI